jgi:hypothetical protein
MSHERLLLTRSMLILEALKILEAATVECKVRAIDTPDVREALDLLEPYCRPK